MFHERLDSLLIDVAASVNYRRAVLMFADGNRSISASMIGVHPKFRETELKGTSGLGYSPLHDKHPLQIAVRCGLPFHTCLNDEFMTAEFSGRAGEDKQRFYERLDEQLSTYRERRLAHLQRVHLVPGAMSLDAFVATQDKNYDIFLEEDAPFNQIYETLDVWNALTNDELLLHYQILKSRGIIATEFSEWSADKAETERAYVRLRGLNLHFSDIFPDFATYASVDPLIGRRFGFSRDQYCHTLMLGVHVQDKLIAVAQFDYPIGVRDFTTPLPLEKQLQAQDQLQRFVPGIVLEGAAHALRNGQAELAEKTLGLLGPDDTIVVQYRTDSANTILLPEPSVRRESAHGAYCVKRFPASGHALVEAKARVAVQHGSIVKTFPVIGHTTKDLVSEILPNIPLYKFLRCLRGRLNEDWIKAALLEHCIDTTRRLQDMTIEIPTVETNYAAKLAEAMHYVLGTGYDSAEVAATAEQLTQGWRNEVRKQDAAPRNISIGLAELAAAYEVSLPINVANMGAASWTHEVATFLAHMVPSVVAAPQRLIDAWPDIEYRADLETMSRLTFRNDDIIELVDAPAWGLSMGDRKGYLAGTTPEERIYRNSRWLLYLDRWIAKKQDREEQRTLIAEQEYHKRTIVHCISETGHGPWILGQYAIALARGK